MSSFQKNIRVAIFCHLLVACCLYNSSPWNEGPKPTYINHCDVDKQTEGHGADNSGFTAILIQEKDCIRFEKT